MSHSVRVGGIVCALAVWSGKNDQNSIDLCRGGLLHDVGKILIPNNILESKHYLTTQEWIEIRKHPYLGHSLIDQLPFSLSKEVKDAVLHHHERWDGRGYPEGLGGVSIPFSARIVAVADGIDAMLSSRPYHPAFSPGSVLDILRSEKNTHYDPSLVSIAQKSFADLQVIRLACENIIEAFFKA